MQHVSISSLLLLVAEHRRQLVCAKSLVPKGREDAVVHILASIHVVHGMVPRRHGDASHSWEVVLATG